MKKRINLPTLEPNMVLEALPGSARNNIIEQNCSVCWIAKISVSGNTSGSDVNNSEEVKSRRTRFGYERL